MSSQSSYNGPNTGPVTGSHHAPSVTVSRTSTPVATISISARQNEIMTALDMDQGLVGMKGSRASLETIWKRYVTIIGAISKVGDGKWESGKKPAEGEIIGVYGGKSAYYDQHKVLQYVRLYPDMVEWLERSDLDPSVDASGLWGYYKTTYVFRDLEKWLAKMRRESHPDRKGKKKATVRNQKGKKADEDEDSTSSPPSKRAHKKSVGGRK
jgi:hypothetical protein